MGFGLAKPKKIFVFGSVWVCERVVFSLVIEAFYTFRNKLFRKVQNAFIAKWLSAALSQKLIR
jgi:hypothetical protein